MRLEASLTDQLTRLVIEAGEAIRAQADAAWRAKADGSPVTDADVRSEAVLLHGLAQLCPGIPVVSEETQSGIAVGERPFFLVDPLDGTRDFIDGRDEYSVNLALIVGGRPTAGFVGAPALGIVWRAAEGRAERVAVIGRGCSPAAAIRTRPAPADGLVVLHSRSHLDPATQAYLARLPVRAAEPCGSALKLARIAEGSADVYPRLAPTQAWDIAAGHALVAAAGGLMVDREGAPLRYDGGSFRIPAFIAWGDQAAARRYGPTLSA